MKSKGMELEQELELFAVHAAWILSSFRGKGKPSVDPNTLMGRRKPLTGGIKQVKALAREQNFERLCKVEED